MPNSTIPPDQGEALRLQEFVSQLTLSQGLIRAFIVSLMPGSPDVGDVLQETNIVLWNSRHKSQALSLMSNTCVLNRTKVRWSSLRAGDRLTLTVSLGTRGDTQAIVWNEGTFFGLVDGSLKSNGFPSIAETVANSGIIAVNPATGNLQGDGAFTDVTFQHIVLQADLKRPRVIGVLLAAGSSKPINNPADVFRQRVPPPPPGHPTSA